jgi:hypothetical protein
MTQKDEIIARVERVMLASMAGERTVTDELMSPQIEVISGFIPRTSSITPTTNKIKAPRAKSFHQEKSSPPASSGHGNATAARQAA